MKLSVTTILFASLMSVVMPTDDYVAGHCSNACVDYSRWSYNCAERENCFSDDVMNNDTAFSACYDSCWQMSADCHSLCLDNFEDVYDICDTHCEGKWVADPDCTMNCFNSDFISRFKAQLPELTEENA